MEEKNNMSGAIITLFILPLAIIALSFALFFLTAKKKPEHNNS